MRNLFLTFLMFLSFVAFGEIRVDTNDGTKMQVRSDNLLKIVSDLKVRGYFSDKVELDKDEIETFVDENSLMTTKEGKKYLIIDADMVERIQFSESNHYHDRNEF